MNRMSCKEKPTRQPSSKNKHYTLMERKMFLQILEKYKHIIETKKSDATTLKDKDIAWNQICEEYNQSALISQERSIQQLKKLWANLKQSQRDALTKERQSYLATGGGPPTEEATVDPDILNIASNLMENAPALFSSNMTEKEIKDKRELAFNIISTDENVHVLHNISKDDFSDENDIRIDLQDEDEFSFKTISGNTNEDKLDNANKEHVVNDEKDIKIIDSQDIFISKKYNKRSITSDTIDIKKEEISKKKKKNTQQELFNSEENLRMQRVNQIIDQEQRLAVVKIKHEEDMAKIKENHLKRLNEMEIKHKNEINNLEIEINKTKLKILENQYSNKENINLRF